MWDNKGVGGGLIQSRVWINVVKVTQKSCYNILYRMVKLIKPNPDKLYVDFIISFESKTGEEVPGPPVRYFFN